ncbi:MAG: Gfo/Idh/MocA family oxidoreductase [Planctomycetes bacterium]|nr:Gfo/Idh/MocA family oxidoreductase [Planctomycetota bacterium]
MSADAVPTAPGSAPGSIPAPRPGTSVVGRAPLRVAVVGCGYWGPNLVRNFNSARGIEVAWICDLDPARLEEMARRFRVGRTTTNVADVLADPAVDAVALATPLATHRPLGEAALRAGKHLWVEKPLAPTVADAEALVALAREHGRTLFVDHTFLYTAAVQKIRDLIARGELGDILYFDSVRVNLGLFQSDTNVLWDLGPHDVSVARYVLGRRPREVSAFGVRHVAGTHENMAYVTLRYDDSLIAHFHFNWLAPVKLRLTMIGGTRRMIVYDDVEQVEKIKLYDKGVDVRRPEANLEERRRALVSYRTGDVWSPTLDQTEALAGAVRDFAGAIAERRAPLSDGECALDVVRVLAAAQRSLEAGGAFVAL